MIDIECETLLLLQYMDCNNIQLINRFCQRLAHFKPSKEIPVQNGQIAIRVLQPLGDDHTINDENTTYPALVWFHGGGERVPLPSISRSPNPLCPLMHPYLGT